MTASLHADALAQLVGWDPPAAVVDDRRREREPGARVDDRQRQRDLAAAYVAHLRDHPDGLWRSCRPDHLTASALVVDPSGSRVLLVHHRKARLWLQTGGHLEPGDVSLADAALREATEESGMAGLGLAHGGRPVRLDRHPAPCAPDVRWHLDVQYVAVAPPGAVPQTGPESLDVAWFGVDDLPEPTDDAVRELVAAAVRLVHQDSSRASPSPADSESSIADAGSPPAAASPSRYPRARSSRG